MHRTALALGLAAAVGLSSGRAQAQEDHAASRTIGDATFMLPALADSAFVLTEFGFRQGINYETIPNFPVASLTRYDLSWVQLEERVDVAVRLTPWLGVYVQGNASGALGPDTASLLFEGGGIDFGGKAGFVVRAYRNEHTRSQLAFRMYAGGDSGRTLDLPDFVVAFAVRTGRDVQGILRSTTSVAQLPTALTNEALTLASSNYSSVIFYRSSTMRLGGSVHYAQALVGPLTLQLAANAEASRSRETPFNPGLQSFVNISETDTTVTLDAVLSASFARWSIPFGVSAEYAGVTTARSLQGANTTTGPTTHYIGGGLWFTGRRGVEIGALAFTQRNLKAMEGFDTSERSGKPTGYAGSLVFRALW